jgi:hypothetical protein
MLATFESPHNLPLPVYAKLAGKSRDQVNREVQKRRLLSLPFGNRGHRIPEWQLDPVRLQLTQAVLERMSSVDPWMLYRMLTQALDCLQGHAPIDVVTHDCVDETVDAVCSALENGLRAA